MIASNWRAYSQQSGIAFQLVSLSLSFRDTYTQTLFSSCMHINSHNGSFILSITSTSAFNNSIHIRFDRQLSQTYYKVLIPSDIFNQLIVCKSSYICFFFAFESKFETHNSKQIIKNTSSEKNHCWIVSCPFNCKWPKILFEIQCVQRQVFVLVQYKNIVITVFFSSELQYDESWRVANGRRMLLLRSANGWFDYRFHRPDFVCVFDLVWVEGPNLILFPIHMFVFSLCPILNGNRMNYRIFYNHTLKSNSLSRCYSSNWSRICLRNLQGTFHFCGYCKQKQCFFLSWKFVLPRVSQIDSTKKCEYFLFFFFEQNQPKYMWISVLWSLEKALLCVGLLICLGIGFLSFSDQFMRLKSRMSHPKLAGMMTATEAAEVKQAAEVIEVYFIAICTVIWIVFSFVTCK